MTPQEILTYVFNKYQPTVVTTSFGEHAAVLLHMASSIQPNATILWLDTHFNTEDTLRFKDHLCESLNLNIIQYAGEPWQSGVPEVGTDEYDQFVEQVKLVPFRTAFEELAPAYWISGIRREQTECRRQSNHFTELSNLTKVAPLLDWTDNDMEQYLRDYHLPNETNYYDPTKPDKYQECGIHTTEL